MDASTINTVRAHYTYLAGFELATAEVFRKAVHLVNTVVKYKKQSFHKTINGC